MYLFDIKTKEHMSKNTDTKNMYKDYIRTIHVRVSLREGLYYLGDVLLLIANHLTNGNIYSLGIICV